MLNQTSNKNKKTMKPGQNVTGPIFYCEDVSVEYGDIRALKNVQLTIEKGEVIFLTGASGAGKTTLLKILSGLVEPTSGKVIRPNYFEGKRNLFISFKTDGKIYL